MKLRKTWKILLAIGLGSVIAGTTTLSIASCSSETSNDNTQSDTQNKPPQEQTEPQKPSVPNNTIPDNTIPSGIVGTKKVVDKSIHLTVLPNKTLEVSSVDFKSYHGGANVVQISNLKIKDNYPIEFNGKTYELPVTKIGDNACATVPGLEKIKIGMFSLPSTLKEIGNNAFSGNVALVGISNIPEGVTKIGNNAFFGCTALTGNLVLPSSLETLGTSAFSGCATLLSVDFTKAKKITSIPDGCFSGCAALGSIDNKDSHVDERQLHIPSWITNIGGKAFWGCKGYKNLIFDNHNDSQLTNIGDNAFAGCSNFEGDLIIPNSVTRIGKSAFQGSYKLPWISRGDPTTDSALREYFQGLDITDRPITIPAFKEQVATFLNASKDNWPTDKKFNPPDGVSFKAEDVQVKDKDFHVKPDKNDLMLKHIQVDCIEVTTADAHPIKYYSLGTALDYDAIDVQNKMNNEKETPIQTFNGKIPTTITLSSNLQVIELDAFKNNTNIKTIKNWPTTLTTIGDQAFQDCKFWVGEVVISNSIISIGKQAFDGCESLTKITVPSSLTTTNNWLPNKKWKGIKDGNDMIYTPKSA